MVDDVASDRLDEALVLLRQLVIADGQKSRRVLRSLGIGHGPADLGARSKGIVRNELSGGKKSS